MAVGLSERSVQSLCKSTRGSVSARTMGSTSEDSEEDGFYERDAETCESCGSEKKSASEDGNGVAAEQTCVGTSA